MPKYDYKCMLCKVKIELTHGFEDASIKLHENCGGTLKKVFNATPAVFKGNGFYKTDNRK